MIERRSRLQIVGSMFVPLALIPLNLTASCCQWSSSSIRTHFTVSDFVPMVTSLSYNGLEARVRARDAVIHVIFMIVFSVASIINTAIGAYYSEHIDS